MSSNPTVAELVRQTMTDRNVSQARAAQAIGLSQAAISRRLAGEVEFTISELARIAQLLDTPLAHFLPSPALAEGGDAA